MSQNSKVKTTQVFLSSTVAYNFCDPPLSFLRACHFNLAHRADPTCPARNMTKCLAEKVSIQWRMQGYVSTKHSY